MVSILFGSVATVAGLLASDRMQMMLTLTTSGVSENEVMLPIGHWLLAAIWITIVALMIDSGRRAAIARCVGVAIALHTLILVTLFVDKLTDREAFSAVVYLRYSQLVCVAALSVSTAWFINWLRRMRAANERLAVIETAIVAGVVALAIALARYNVLMTLAAIVGGVVLAFTPSRVGDAFRRITSNDSVFLGAVFIAALALRLLYVRRIMGDPDYLDTGADGRIYDQLAWQIATGGRVPEWFTNRFPLLLLGYVWFVAAIYKLAGHSYFAAAAVQSLLGAATCICVFAIARPLFGLHVARLAAIFVAVNFSLIFAAAALGHQAVDVFVTALAVWLLIYLRAHSGSWQGWAAAGVITAAAITVRETAIFFAAFACLWIIASFPQGWRASKWAITAYAIGAAALLTPFVFPKISSESGRDAMRGHFERMYRGEGEGTAMPRPDLISPVADPSAAARQFRDAPGHVIGTLLRSYATNFSAQFFAQPYGGFDLVFLRKGTAYHYAMWFYAYALTVIGAVITCRMMLSRRFDAAAAAMILGVIVSRTVPHLILVSNYRHRVPIEPFLILLASVGAVSLWERINPRPPVAAK
jgi:hypothetical protein